MAAGNQGQGKGQGQGPGQGQGRERKSSNDVKSGTGEGLRERVQDLGQDSRREAEHLGDRLSNGLNAGREEVSRKYREAEGLVARYPAPSVLLGFGVGFGIGLALTALLVQREETWAERYIPGSLRDLPGRLRNARVPDEVRDLPDSIHGHLHSLGETVRDLPSAIARSLHGR